ncbi:group-specific protein [Cytobacillus oceanisediminis]|uniref:group-specific protein n=1 Tax=Cytobacillus oceanisediminis TaxID=665099 RepID=UPI001863F697|nr:group-specific protein [Cytobacillus oceanisediminis]QOK28031.1 group-specific protein [Cytobacillus oceanisediminis]
MLDIQIDKQELRKIYLEKLEEHLNEIEGELIFWDAKELQKRTCMSWNTIQKEFFFEPNFPKHKVGNKWYFPAAETKQFLLYWLSKK